MEKLKLGSVIKLADDALESVVIIGYDAKGADQCMYHYVGVLYPAGFTGDNAVVFNHSDIKVLVYST